MLYRHPVGLDQLGGTDQLAHCLLDRFDLGWSGRQADAVSFIANQAAKAQTLRGRQLRQGESRFAGRRSTAAHPRIDIDHHTQRHLCLSRMPQRGQRPCAHCRPQP